MRRNYIMLISMAQSRAQLVQAALARLRREVDQNATPAWLDSTAACIFVSTDLDAKAVLGCMLPGNPTHEQIESVKDVVVIELGRDFYGWSTSTKTMAWLNSHRPPHP